MKPAANRLLRSAPAWVVMAAFAWRFLPDVPARSWLGGVALAAFAVFLVIRLPAAAAGLAVAGAAYVGGWAVLAAAPAVLLLGYRASAPFRAGPAPGRWRWLAAAMLLAALATVPFARLGYERPGGGGGADGSPSSRLRPGRDGAAAPTGGSRLGEQLVAFLRRLVRPESNPRWWLLALVMAVLLALIGGLVVWLVRRRRRPAPGLSATLSAVERLEAVGRRIGRRRRPDEGMLGYASALAERTGDGRLAAAGPEVSAVVYHSPAASGARVEQALGALEASPPSRPPRRRSLPATVRHLREQLGYPRVAAGVAAAVVVVGAVGVVVPRLSVLGTDTGPGTLWSEPSSTVEQWWSCTAFDGNTEARAGVDHLTRERAATRVRRTIGPAVFEGDEGTWDGRSSVASDGDDEYPVDSGLVRPWRPFADLDRVLDAFGLTAAPVVTTHRDATGAPFTRYESMPLAPPDQLLPAVERIGARWEMRVVWVLDVWLDGSGHPVRLRQMIDGDPGRWEWLRLDQPTGSSTPPTCGVDSGGGAGRGPWLGAEPWTPTLEVPLQVAYDAAGHPYDPLPGAAEGTWSTLGDLRSLGGTVTIGALEVLDAETVAVEPGATVRVDHYGSEVADGHHLQVGLPGDAGGGGGPVVTWRLVGEVDLMETTPVVMVIPPGVDAERIERVYDELGTDWTGKQLDLDGDGADDMMVLAGYGGLTLIYAGEDATGRVVELVTLAEGLPWRVLGQPGPAPPDVVERERELTECAAGTRTIGPDGVCQRG